MRMLGKQTHSWDLDLKKIETKAAALLETICFYIKVGDPQDGHAQIMR